MDPCRAQDSPRLGLLRTTSAAILPYGPSTGRIWAVNLGIGFVLLSEFIIYRSVQKTRLLDHSFGHSLGTCPLPDPWLALECRDLGCPVHSFFESMEVHSLLRARLCTEACKGLLSLLPSLPPMESELD